MTPDEIEELIESDEDLKFTLIHRHKWPRERVLHLIRILVGRDHQPGDDTVRKGDLIAIAETLVENERSRRKVADLLESEFVRE